jgi:hypothetical protein
LRFLLLLPVLAAAFYGGWTAHDRHVHRRFEMQDAEALQRRTALLREMAYKRQRDAERLRSMIDRVEHRKRMDTFRLHSVGPFKARMSQNGRF